MKKIEKMNTQYFWISFILALIVGIVLGMNITLITKKSVENKYDIIETYARNLAIEVKNNLTDETKAIQKIELFAIELDKSNYKSLVEYGTSAFYGELLKPYSYLVGEILPSSKIEAKQPITGEIITSTKIE